MPAKSEQQRQAAGAALAAKRAKGDRKKKLVAALYGAARQMYEGMSIEQLEHFARKVN